jgi:hypothetical protein
LWKYFSSLFMIEIATTVSGKFSKNLFKTFFVFLIGW